MYTYVDERNRYSFGPGDRKPLGDTAGFHIRLYNEYSYFGGRRYWYAVYFMRNAAIFLTHAVDRMDAIRRLMGIDTIEDWNNAIYRENERLFSRSKPSARDILKSGKAKRTR